MVRPVLPVLGPLAMATLIPAVFHYLMAIQWPLVVAYVAGSFATALTMELHVRQRRVRRQDNSANHTASCVVEGKTPNLPRAGHSFSGVVSTHKPHGH